MSGTRSMFSLLIESFGNKWHTLPETIVDLTGRTVIVTGANTGLGLEAAKKFYALNPEHLVLAVRTVSKGEEAKRTVLQTPKPSPHGTSRGETQVHVWALDLGSFDSVKAFAEKCEKELGRIDVLLENAGTSQQPGAPFKQTADGYEPVLQTNVLSTFLLAALLAPLIARTAKLPIPQGAVQFKPHLVIVASDVHYVAPFRNRNEPNIIAALNDPKKWIPDDRYYDTKTIDVLLTQTLGTHPLLKDVTVCCVNPGLCKSELMRDFPGIVRFILLGLFARTSEEGAKAYTWASLADGIPNGSYTSSCRVETPGGIIATPDGNKVRPKLWKETGVILEKIAPTTHSIWDI